MIRRMARLAVAAVRVEVDRLRAEYAPLAAPPAPVVAPPVELTAKTYSRCIRCWDKPPAEGSMVCDPACGLPKPRAARKPRARKVAS